MTPGTTRRPLVGVTTSRRGGWRAYPFHRLAIWRAGGRAVRLVAGRPVPDGLDGLVIGGGDDIGAELYGGQVLPDVRLDPERDRLEIDLFHAAARRRLPVLGICRGAQMINIARGGTLVTDIHAVYVAAPRMRTVLPKKTVRIAPGSRLSAILACDPTHVNALHHQSVDRVGAGLAVVARDEAGIVQAIEGTGETFLVGVQWHPELLVAQAPHQRLFEALVAAAAAGTPAPAPAMSGG
jgi:putative glutamine amidotransferase